MYGKSAARTPKEAATANERNVGTDGREQAAKARVDQIGWWRPTGTSSQKKGS
jgi:hypothetical protein